MQQVFKDLAKEYSLGEWNIARVLSTGFVNENYKIDTSCGSFFLRFYRQQSLNRVENEIDLMQALREIEFPTAYPIAKSNGEFVSSTSKGIAVLFEFLSGETPEVTYDTAFQIGTEIGKLSQLESRWQSSTNQINMEFCESTIPKLPESTQHSRLFERFVYYRNALKAVAQVDLPTGTVHSDVFPDNTLFQGGRLVGIVDFESFCHETLLYDLAMTINGFGFVDNQLAISPLQGICTGYWKQRNLDAEELRLLPRYIQLTALVMSCWHINNGIINTKNKRSIDRAEELIDRIDNLESSFIQTEPSEFKKLFF